MNTIQVISVKIIPSKYNNIFLKEGVKPMVCPDGYKRAFLGEKLRVPVCISMKSFPMNSIDDIETEIGPNPEEYGIDALICQQQMADGRIILGWIKD